MITRQIAPFNELTDKNGYWLAGRRLPSVTELMRPIQDDLYKDIPADILSAAQDRGKQIHSAIQLYVEIGVKEIKAPFLPQLEAFIAWERDFKPEYGAVEFAVYHPFLFYGGRIDLIAYIDGIPTVIDVKSNAKPPIDNTSIQLSGYRDGLESHGRGKFGVGMLWLNRFGDYQYFKEQDMPMENGFQLFMACHKIWEHKQMVKDKY